MASRIYQVGEEYVCSGDVIGMLIDDQPWSEWVELGNDPDQYSVEVTLSLIARHFGIDRRDRHQLEAEKFPIRITHPPEPPAFCRICMQWFS